ncbi:hypothetical protein QE152_g30638 [Popillia japonica]|uniref:Uncharacterized protein n=1 Tax=Popillia japonica TaxID=7064 RepID=A0AAW1JE54_POPJA
MSDNRIETRDNIDKMDESAIDWCNNLIGDLRREMERLNDAHKLIEWERGLLRKERKLLQREREILNGTLNQSQVRKTESIGSAYSLHGTTLMKLRGAARLWLDGAP